MDQPFPNLQHDSDIALIPIFEIYGLGKDTQPGTKNSIKNAFLRYVHWFSL